MLIQSNMVFPVWLSQLSSLKKKRMEELCDQHERMEDAQAFYLEHRVVERVNSIPLDQLLRRHGLSSLDLLQIDVEGYDYEILKTLDFDQIRPLFINYERVLLADTEEECRQMLV